jgi:hypothetical protein
LGLELLDLLFGIDVTSLLGYLQSAPEALARYVTR